MDPRRAEPPGRRPASGAGATSSRSTAARSPGGTVCRLAAGRAGDPAHARRADDLDERQQRHRHPAAPARPRECRADDDDDRRARRGRATGPCSRRSNWRRSRPAPPPRSTPGGRPTRRAGGRCSPTRYADADAAAVDVARFSGNPLAIDSVEWFASAADLVRTMDWLRRNGDETARAILAINPALGAAAARRARLCRLQGRLRARRAQPHLAGPEPRRRLARRHRQLEQSRRAASTSSRFAGLMARGGAAGALGCINRIFAGSALVSLAAVRSGAMTATDLRAKRHGGDGGAVAARAPFRHCATGPFRADRDRRGRAPARGLPRRGARPRGAAGRGGAAGARARSRPSSPTDKSLRHRLAALVRSSAGSPAATVSICGRPHQRRDPGRPVPRLLVAGCSPGSSPAFAGLIA